jgi:signal transduction histidine kinase
VRRGPPTRIEVRIAPTADGGVEAVVADDAEPERRRRSLESVEQRVKQLHGSIAFEGADGGSKVTVTLPSYATRR